jgi:hypothetical protein
MNSGRDQTCFISRDNTTLEFSVPSSLTFRTINDIPGNVSTVLMTQNAKQRIGFWCIEKIGEQYVYSCMHNAEMQLINVHFFARIVNALINQCDEFEDYMARV